MTNILDRIVKAKREEVAQLLPQTGRIKQAVATRKDYRDFAGALKRDGNVALIAEVKKASPSAGVIVHNFDPEQIACEYAKAGAAALSVLTDEKFFQGKLEYLRLIRGVVQLPLLRKDFIIDELQVYEAAAAGADAILLIAAILTEDQLRNYRALASHLKMAALVEVHDEHELDRAIHAGASLIGINNRDLRTFKVDLGTTEHLARTIRSGVLSEQLIIAESGIQTRADVDRVRKAGAAAILVGESLVKSGNICGKIKEFLG